MRNGHTSVAKASLVSRAEAGQMARRASLRCYTGLPEMGRAIKVLVECRDSEEGYLEDLLHGEAAQGLWKALERGLTN